MTDDQWNQLRPFMEEWAKAKSAMSALTADNRVKGPREHLEHVAQRAQTTLRERQTYNLLANKYWHVMQEEIPPL